MAKVKKEQTEGERTSHRDLNIRVTPGVNQKTGYRMFRNSDGYVSCDGWCSEFITTATIKKNATTKNKIKQNATTINTIQ